jgi:hypothetical protein
VKIYRVVRTSNQPLDEVLLSSLREHQNPIPPDAEASDLDFVPSLFRSDTAGKN